MSWTFKRCFEYSGLSPGRYLLRRYCTASGEYGRLYAGPWSGYPWFRWYRPDHGQTYDTGRCQSEGCGRADALFRRIKEKYRSVPEWFRYSAETQSYSCWYWRQRPCKGCYNCRGWPWPPSDSGHGRTLWMWYTASVLWANPWKWAEQECWCWLKPDYIRPDC